jgi:lysozyme
MKTNEEGIKLLHSFESCEKKLPDGRIQSYKCPAGIWTIGWGNTFYEDGSRVREADIITKERADLLFKNILARFEQDVKSLLKTKVTENQFSALVSFAYNVGSDIDLDSTPEGLGDSTLLRKVNRNPWDPTIKDEFMKWKRSNGVVLNGLVRRRQAEANLYFKK